MLRSRTLVHIVHRFLERVDWLMLVPAILLVLSGLVTMNSYVGENILFERQIIWTVVALLVFTTVSLLDFRFLRRSGAVTILFVGTIFLLLITRFIGSTFLGAQSWIDLGFFAIQPSDLAKLVLIIVLAKYFSRRHVEIAHIRHILVSGAYAAILFLLVFLQPDFGSAIILATIWLGMVLISGISKRHLIAVFALAAVSFAGLWLYGLADYQKQRVISFLHPLADLQGSGYNAYQSMVAVGSGELFGKGVGFGTQSKLQFLPEYETDFIFAAFAEEWGFVGVVVLFALFALVVWRILTAATYGATNFEVLFAAGFSILLMSQFAVHVGMNIGLLPVTGVTIPFMSYGGSHLVTEFLAFGIITAQRAYARAVHKEDASREFVGLESV